MMQRNPENAQSAPALPRADEPQTPTANTRRRTTLLVAALLAVAAVAYSPTLDAALLFDDGDWINENVAIKDLSRFLSHDLWSHIGASGRALTELTFALNYAQSRLGPRAYHVTNIAIHLAAILLAYLLGRRLFAALRWPRPERPALAAAALWGLHPLGSQAVSYITQRAESLASMLYLASVLLVLVAIERGRSAAGIGAFVAAIFTALLGFQAKPILITLPVAVLAALMLVDRPRAASGNAWLHRIGLTAPFAVASVAFGLGTLREVLDDSVPDVGFDVEGITPSSYAITQIRAVAWYLRLFVWPAGLNLDYDVEPSSSLLEAPVLISAAALAALCAGVAMFLAWSRRLECPAALRRAALMAAFGVAWFFVLLSPSSTFVPVVDLVVEHRAYLASWGLALAVVAFGALALERVRALGARRGMAGAVLTLALCAALALALYARNVVWAHPAKLWSDVIAKSPRKWRGYHNLAEVLITQGDHAGATRLLEKAVALSTEPAHRGESLRSLGAEYLELGRVDRAIWALLEAERLRPNDAGVQNNLALCYHEQGLGLEAELRARKALSLAPTSSNAYTTLGQLLAARGDLKGALEAFQRASAINPDELPPLYNVAVAQEELGLLREACASWMRYARAGGSAASAEAREALRRLRCSNVE